jgi:hypothetical protein
MVSPSIIPWIENSYQFPTFRVSGYRLCKFRTVATMAGKRQIFKVVATIGVDMVNGKPRS